MSSPTTRLPFLHYGDQVVLGCYYDKTGTLFFGVTNSTITPGFTTYVPSATPNYSDAINITVSSPTDSLNQSRAIVQYGDQVILQSQYGSLQVGDYVSCDIVYFCDTTNPACTLESYLWTISTCYENQSDQFVSVGNVDVGNSVTITNVDKGGSLCLIPDPNSTYCSGNDYNYKSSLNLTPNSKCLPIPSGKCASFYFLPYQSETPTPIPICTTCTGSQCTKISLDGGAKTDYLCEVAPNVYLDSAACVCSGGPVACNNNSDCPSGQYCISGQCLQQCATNSDCPQGESCVQNVCTEPLPVDNTSTATVLVIVIMGLLTVAFVFFLYSRSKKKKRQEEKGIQSLYN